MGDIDINAARALCERTYSIEFAMTARTLVPALLDELEQTKGALQLAMSTLTNTLNAVYESAGIPDHVDDFDYLIDRITTLSASKARTRELEATVQEAMSLVDYAMVIVQFGERAPGGDETWAEFERRARALRGSDV